MPFCLYMRHVVQRYARNLEWESVWIARLTYRLASYPVPISIPTSAREGNIPPERKAECFPISLFPLFPYFPISISTSRSGGKYPSRAEVGMEIGTGYEVVSSTATLPRAAAIFAEVGLGRDYSRGGRTRS